jgi:hypothetical protein
MRPADYRGSIEQIRQELLMKLALLEIQVPPIPDGANEGSFVLDLLQFRLPDHRELVNVGRLAATTAIVLQCDPNGLEGEACKTLLPPLISALKASGIQDPIRLVNQSFAVGSSEGLELIFQAVIGKDELPATGAKTRVFISYRRSDTRQIAGWIAAELRKEGVEVFLDTITISPGASWKSEIERAITNCDALLVLIGNNWDYSRLTDSMDMVRVEISLALQLGRPVFPVLIDRAPAPRANDLPDDLASLAEFQCAHLDTGPDFSSHFKRINDAIRRIRK